jgi:WhiB family redox-sensing transcriptional regulator
MATKKSTKREVKLRDLYTGEAKCEQIGEMIFFPKRDDPNEYTQLAKETCFECPLLESCREYAIHTQVDGIWGGMTTRERQRYRAKHNIIPKELSVA